MLVVYIAFPYALTLCALCLKMLEILDFVWCCKPTLRKMDVQELLHILKLLMVLPIFLGMSAHHSAGTTPMISGTAVAAIIATVLHAASYLLVTAAIALLVFEKLGIGVLRKAWLNVSVVWAVALIGTGVATLLM